MQRAAPCDTLGFPPLSHSALFFSNSTLHTSVPHLGAFTWFQYLNFPRLCLSAMSCMDSFGFKTSPSRLLTTFARISTGFQCLSLSFPCLSATSCAHLVSVPNFPLCAFVKLPKLPAFIGFQSLYFPRSLPMRSSHFNI